MYPSLSVLDFVNYMAELKGIHDKKAVGEVLEQVEMQEFSRFCWQNVFLWITKQE